MRFIYAQVGCRKPKPVCANDNLDDFGERRAIPGLPNCFTVSSFGFVYKAQRKLKGFASEKGYRRVSLRIDGKDANYYVHALVGAAFIGPRPEGFHIDHVNFNPSDNRPENLRYLPAVENSMRTRRRGGKSS